MRIETKFGFGDTLHVISDNRPHTFDVGAIIVKKDKIEYGADIYRTYDEDTCFVSREELRDFIMNG